MPQKAFLAYISSPQYGGSLLIDTSRSMPYRKSGYTNTPFTSRWGRRTRHQEQTPHIFLVYLLGVRKRGFQILGGGAQTRQIETAAPARRVPLPDIRWQVNDSVMASYPCNNCGMPLCQPATIIYGMEPPRAVARAVSGKT